MVWISNSWYDLWFIREVPSELEGRTSGDFGPAGVLCPSWRLDTVKRSRVNIENSV